jgi:hypothetical protein
MYFAPTLATAKIIAIMMITAFCFVLSSQPSYADMHAAKSDHVGVGVVLAVQGKVGLKHNDEIVFPQPGHPVDMGDSIETGEDARVLIMFDDRSEFTLGENALAKIDEYVYDPITKENQTARLEIAKGAFLWVTGIIARDDQPDIEISTSFGSIGIRGTTVWGGELDDLFQVFVADGRVVYKTNRGFLTLSPGEGSNVDDIDMMPSRRAVWPEGKINRALETISFTDTAYVEEQRRLIADVPAVEVIEEIVPIIEDIEAIAPAEIDMNPAGTPMEKKSELNEFQNPSNASHGSHKAFGTPDEELAIQRATQMRAPPALDDRDVVVIKETVAEMADDTQALIEQPETKMIAPQDAKAHEMMEKNALQP